MKIFLIIIGCIFLYIFGTFITFVLFLYCDRCYSGSSMAYDDIDSEDFWLILVWPLTIWILLGYLLYLKLKKYAIAITEVLYQINHKEIMEKKEQEKELDIDAVARDVIQGKYGNGDDRKKALGENYSMVQKRVNELMKHRQADKG